MIYLSADSHKSK